MGREEYNNTHENKAIHKKGGYDFITGNNHFKDSTKEYGVNRELMDSLALYIYCMDYSSVPTPLQIFNSWSEASGYKPQNAKTLSGIIEHIRKLSKVDRKDLEEALRLDNLLKSDII